MPRRPRIDIPNTVYHVFTRGHNKTALFLDDQDRFVFLKYLKRAQDLFPWDCLGYTLMSNHFHLQVRTLKHSLGKTMHLLNLLYAGYFNFRYKKVGHVFQNRFHSIPVQTDQYLLVLSRYIHLNPIVANLVRRPEDYAWSSYREYIGKAYSGLVKTDTVLNLLSDDASRQRSRYQEFVNDGMTRKPDFDEAMIWKTRVFGDATFTSWVAAKCPAAFAPRNAHRAEIIN